MRRRRWIGAGLLLAALAAAAVVARRDSNGVLVASVSVGTDPHGVAVDPLTGRAFVTNYFSSNVSVIDTHSGALLTTVAVGQTPLSVAVDARTNRVFVLNLVPSPAITPIGSLSTLDATTGAVVRTTPLTTTVDLAVDDHSGHVFQAGDEGGIYATAFMLDAHSGRLLRTAALYTGAASDPQGGYVAGLAVDTRTQRVFIASFGTNTVDLLDTVRGTVVRRIKVGASPTGVAVDTQTNRAFVTNRTDDTVSMLDARSGGVLRTLPVGQGPLSLAVDTRTRRVFVVNETAGSVCVLDARTGRRYRTVSVGAIRPQPEATANPVDLAVDERWGHVFVLNEGAIDQRGRATPGSVSVLDATSGPVVRTIAVGINPSALAVDEAAGRLVVVNTGPPGPTRVQDPWGWMPSWLRSWLPWTAPPIPNPLKGSVTLLDLAHV